MPYANASASPLFCPDDGLVLRRAAQGVYVCHCRGTLLTREAFHREARELLESAPPRSSEPDVACPRCRHITGLLRIRHKDRWPHWCENCGTIWLRAEDLNALAEVRRDVSGRATTGGSQQALEQREGLLRKALTAIFLAPPWVPESKWDPPTSRRPSGFTVEVDGLPIDAAMLSELIVGLINWTAEDEEVPPSDRS